MELSSEGSRARLEGTTSEVEAASEVNEWLKEFSEYESSEVVKERTGNVESPERETVASHLGKRVEFDLWTDMNNERATYDGSQEPERFLKLLEMAVLADANKSIGTNEKKEERKLAIACRKMSVMIQRVKPESAAGEFLDSMVTAEILQKLGNGQFTDNDWQIIRKQFVSRFGKEVTPTEGMRILNNIKQANRSVDEYNNMYEKAKLKVSSLKLSNDALVMAYIQGLDNNVEGAMQHALTTSFKENKAIPALESVMEMARAAAFNVKVTQPQWRGGNANRSYPSNQAGAAQAWRAVSGGSNPGVMQRTGYVDRATWLQRGRDGVCRRCGKPGHWQADCPAWQGNAVPRT